MAARKPKEPEEIAEIAKSEPVQEIAKVTHESIELHDNYSNHTSIIHGIYVIDFTNGNPSVDKATAEELRKQGIIK